MKATPPETTQPWAPNMIYRARRHKSLPDALCEQFIEQQVFTCFRTYLPIGGPNFDYGPTMERATRFILYIELLRDDLSFRDAFSSMLRNQTTPNSMAAATFQDRELATLLQVLLDTRDGSNDQLASSRAYKLDFYARDPAMVDQLVWGLTHPHDAHPGVSRDVDDPFFIAVLLIRHFKHHGGLVLPPLQAARAKQAVHETLIASERALGRPTQTLFMHYPNWRDSQGLVKPPGLGGPARADSSAPSMASGYGGSSLNERPPPVEEPSAFGAVGDRRPRR